MGDFSFAEAKIMNVMRIWMGRMADIHFQKLI